MDNRTDEERLVTRLAELPEEIAPERDLWPGIASRLERPRPLRRVLLQVAAAIAIFIGGLVAGSQSRPASVTAAAPQPRAEVAADIQRKGTDYVAAISALARESDELRRTEGREVALATIYGALAELQRSTGETVPEAMRAVDQRREEVSQRAETISLVRF